MEGSDIQPGERRTRQLDWDRKSCVDGQEVPAGTYTLRALFINNHEAWLSQNTIEFTLAERS